MNTINDGGPAFLNVPDGAGDRWGTWDMGMTLRDYFAAKAMQGDIAAGADKRPDVADCAAWAYKMADAMLAARGAQ
ncbi:hypothetical protein C1I89_10290 [Achromobacter pulmonis]|uniref:Uncharacterized protein n=1 Tax=Achromobacter pulmonis TaxID=1389932 RepID=A0A2N8KM79_9BURK|nr:hypothetical protein [Achromobacter pulmonis]PND34560.1 hypothetical protein C1I89_10290 [Achromobacter pulmonis]